MTRLPNDTRNRAVWLFLPVYTQKVVTSSEWQQNRIISSLQTPYSGCLYYYRIDRHKESMLCQYSFMRLHHLRNQIRTAQQTKMETPDTHNPWVSRLTVLRCLRSYGMKLQCDVRFQWLRQMSFLLEYLLFSHVSRRKL